MGFVLLIIGLLMIITGARGTYTQFGSQVASEFQGPNSFTYQMLALGTIGLAGYIPALETISRWALALILLVILLSSKGSTGFFTQLQQALKSGPVAPQTPPSAGGTTSTVTSTVKQAATGQNPGSDMLGQFTYENFTKPFLDFFRSFGQTK